jgi:carbohydrate diacid regulator
MILKEVIQKSLEELRDIAKIQAALLQPDGTYYAGTLRQEKIEYISLETFWDSEAEFQELPGFYLFRMEEEDPYILITQANRSDAAVMGKLVLAQIRNLILVNQEKNSQENFLKSLLEGKISEESIFAKAEKFHMNLEQRRAIFLIELMEGKEDGVFEVIKNIGETPEDDILFKVEENRIALMKRMGDGEGEEEQRELALTLVDMINVEAMAKARVAYGTPVNRSVDLSISYREAKFALEVGKIFYANKNTISYRKLGIGRLLYRLPKDLCETFMKEVVGTNLDDVLDPETLSTIYRFFENGLNVSETARQLYVHRNTLVYRLEKIQKQLGLDIRQFDDAVTFKIAMMVDNYLKWERR